MRPRGRFVVVRKIKTLPHRVATLSTAAAPFERKRAESFYLSPAWRALLARIIRRRGRVCEDRECKGPHTAGQVIYGDHIVEIVDGGFFMIHNSWSIALGNASDFRKTADLLDQIDGTIVATYAKRTGLDEATLRDMLAAETWIGAQQAVDEGWANRIAGEKPKAQLNWNVSALLPKFESRKREPVAPFGRAHDADGQLARHDGLARRGRRPVEMDARDAVARGAAMLHARDDFLADKTSLLEIDAANEVGRPTLFSMLIIIAAPPRRPLRLALLIALASIAASPNPRRHAARRTA